MITIDEEIDLESTAMGVLPKGKTKYLTAGKKALKKAYGS